MANQTQAARRCRWVVLSLSAGFAIALSTNLWLRHDINLLLVACLLVGAGVASWCLIVFPDRRSAAKGAAIGAIYQGKALLDVSGLKKESRCRDHTDSARTWPLVLTNGDVTGELLVTPTQVHWQPSRFAERLRIPPVSLSVGEVVELRIVPVLSARDSARIAFVLA